MMMMMVQPWNAKLKELYASAMDKSLTEWVLERFEGVSYTHMCPAILYDISRYDKTRHDTTRYDSI